MILMLSVLFLSWHQFFRRNLLVLQSACSPLEQHEWVFPRTHAYISLFFLILTWGYIYCFERQRDRERTMMWKTLISCLLYLPWTGDQTCKLGMCPDWEPNPWPFGVWDHAPTKWAIQPGQSCVYIEYIRWFPDFGQRTEHTLNLPYAMYFSRIF